MQVAILAGGLGTRLRPVTEKIPKCMAPVGGKPFLFYLLRLLKLRGAEEVILCIGYLGEQVEKYFDDGEAVGLKLRYSREEKGLLGTGGALKLAEPMLQDSFLVVNGDTYLDIDYEAIYHEFTASKAPALIVASPCVQNTRCDLAVDSQSFVTRYDKTDSTGLDYVNAGVMGLKREVLSSVMPGQAVSLEADIFPRLIERHAVKAHISAEPFYDIGSFAGLGIFEKVLKDISA